VKTLDELEKDVQKMQELLAKARGNLNSARGLHGQADEHAADASAFMKQAISANKSAEAARDLARQNWQSAETILKMIRKGKWSDE
jgi:uncharacterized coiled-coil DUF342 family protein